MKKLVKFFNTSTSTRYAAYITVFLFLILSSTLTFLSIDFFVQYSSLFVGLTKAIIGMLALSAVDDIIFGKIDTMNAIREKNISYAIFYLANAIIIAACIAFA